MRTITRALVCTSMIAVSLAVLAVVLLTDCDTKSIRHELATDGTDAYLPLRFRPEAKRVELFVIGDGRAVKPVVDSAIRLMNYGDDERSGRITVLADDGVLPEEEIVSALPEVELADCGGDYADMIRRLQLAAEREDTAVTLVIAGESHDVNVKTYMRLPLAVRRRKLSVLLWMDAQTRDLPDKSLICGGWESTSLRYFGMSDLLPWMDDSRLESAVIASYFYSVSDRLPKGDDPGILEASARLWNPGEAGKAWAGLTRWAKWSNVSSGDSFKERANMIRVTGISSETLRRLLKAEHNRWWAERLLSDWRPGPRTGGDPKRLHPNLVPFEKLDEKTRELDKISIATMSACGCFNR